MEYRNVREIFPGIGCAWTNADGKAIQSYMTHGVERVVGDIIKSTFRNPRERLYGETIYAG